MLGCCGVLLAGGEVYLGCCGVLPGGEVFSCCWSSLAEKFCLRPLGSSLLVEKFTSRVLLWKLLWEFFGREKFPRPLGSSSGCGEVFPGFWSPLPAAGEVLPPAAGGVLLLQEVLPLAAVEFS